MSKRWGVPSNRRISPAVRDRFVGLACEYLAAQHDYSGSAETLRGWMIEAGLWKASISTLEAANA